MQRQGDIEMSEFSHSLRSFIYAMICMECLLQLTNGSSYHRYMKLFTHILMVCISCSMIFGVVNQWEEKMLDMDKMYEEWLEQWDKMEVSVND